MGREVFYMRRKKPPDPFSGYVPAFAAQRIHQLHRPFDELGRLVDFLDRLAAVRMSDDEAIAACGAIAADFVAEFLSVPIEEPNHDQVAYTERVAMDSIG